MAQTGFTPIQIYSSSTAAAAPVAGSLTNSTLGSELAINITDGKLFYKDNANVIQVIGWKVVPAVAGGTGQTSYAIGDILFANTTTTLAKLADVATGNALISGGVGVAPSYGKIGLTTHVSGVLPVANGGTNASTASITSFNNITGYTATGATGTTSTDLVFSTSPSITTPTLIGDVTLSTGNLVIGTSGKGIDFSATPGTGTSELFADYEEGTWTATIFNGANNATMGAGGTCQYTKIGRLVTLHGYLYTTSLGSVTGSLSISGLPFTPLAGGANFTASAVGFGDSLAITAGQSVGIRFTPNSTNAALFVWDDATGSTAMQDTEWTSNGEIMFTANYLTAS
jgi:hypothetical protein